MQDETPCEQASVILSVSGPVLIERWEEGDSSGRRVGTHRRIRQADLMAYKKAIDKQRSAAMDELASQAQELGMGY